MEVTGLPDWFDDDTNKTSRYMGSMPNGSGASVTVRLRVEAGTEFSPWVEQTVTLL
jgi:hypothetical protein